MKDIHWGICDQFLFLGKAIGTSQSVQDGFGSQITFSGITSYCVLTVSRFGQQVILRPLTSVNKRELFEKLWMRYSQIPKQHME